MALLRRKTKHKNGFTLPEVLVVVALIAVLLTFAVPAILGFVRRLKLRALDTDAQSIFVAAQHRLTAMAESGELERLRTGAGTADTNTVAVAQSGGGSVDGLTWLSSDGTEPDRVLDLQSVLPAGSIEARLHAGHYVVEFSKAGGIVYGVWYTDEDTLDYAALLAARSTDQEKFETRLEQDVLVGFYGGGSIPASAAGPVQMPVPQVDLLNAELLRLRVTVPMVDASLDGEAVSVHVRLRGRSPADGTLSEPVELALGSANMLTLSDGGAVIGDVILDAAWPQAAQALVYPGGVGSTSTVGGESVTLLADAKQFYDWVDYHYNNGAPAIAPTSGANYDTATNSPRIRPGEDIEVSVWLEYGGATPAQSLTVTANTNSLFAALTQNTGAGGADTYTAQLTCGRHLQNLCTHVNANATTGRAPAALGGGAYQPFVSGLDIVDSHGGAALTAAMLVGDIDFLNLSAGDPALSWTQCYGVAADRDDSPTAYNASAYSDPDSLVRPHRFEAIYAVDGTVMDGQPAAYTYHDALKNFNGNSKSIRGLNVDYTALGSLVTGNDMPHAGLFGALVGETGAPCRVTDLNLINCQALGTRLAGTVAAAARDAVFTNCHVWLEDLGAGQNHALAVDGGLPVAHVSSAGGSAGGLLGQSRADTVNIENSSASTVLDAGTDGAAGGLAGAVDGGVTVKTSYAACYTLRGASAGGLLGSAAGGGNITINASYAAGYIRDVEAGGSAGGLLGSAGGALTDLSITNSSYAAVRYGTDLAANAAANGTALCGLFPQNALVAGAPGDPYETCYYVPQLGINDTAFGGAVTRTELHGMVGTGGYTAANGWYEPRDTAGDPALENPTYAAFPYHQADRAAGSDPGGANPDNFVSGSRLSTPYPYPMLTAPVTGLLPPGGASVPMVHYGDWLESESALSAQSIAYFVKYDDESSTTGAGRAYGFYALTWDGSGTPVPLYDTLYHGDHPVHATTDGYAILSSAALSGAAQQFTVAWDGGTQVTSGSNLVQLGTGPFTVGGQTLYAYTLPTAAWDDAVAAAKANGAGYYQTLTVNGGSQLLFNPLFGREAVNVTAAPGVTVPTEPLAKPEDPATTGAYATAANHIILETARQLANAADKTDPNLNPTNAAAYQRMAYDQLLDIDYVLYEQPNNGSSANFVTGKSDGTNAQKPMMLDHGSYDGHRHTIRGLHAGAIVDNSTAYGGLIGHAESSTLKDITLVNTTAKTTPANTTGAFYGYLGALAGFVNGSQITNCGAYVEADSYPTGVTGGYTTVDDAYTACYVQDSTNIASGTYVGGLIGSMSDWTMGGSVSTMTVTNSYAAVHVVTGTGTTTAGGFVGSMSDSTVTDCYAGGHTTGGVYDAAAPNIISNNDAGGFVGDYQGGSFAGICYSTASVAAGSGGALGAFAGKCQNNISKPVGTGMLYATGATYSANMTVHFPAVPRDESDYLTGLLPSVTWTGSGDSAFATGCYDGTLSSGYPYPSNLAAHHGDWADRPVLVYYEVYASNPGNANQMSDGRWYGFYAEWTDAGGTSQYVNTLSTTDRAVDSGYAFLSRQRLTPASNGELFVWRTESYGSGGPVTQSGTAYTTSSTSASATADTRSAELHLTQQIDDMPSGWYLYTLPFAALNQAPTDAYYREISINGVMAAYNPHFACEALNSPNGTPTARTNNPAGAEYTLTDYVMDADHIQAKNHLAGADSTNDYYANRVLIRTPWNFANIARYTRGRNPATAGRDASRTWSYHQLLDLDFAAGAYTGGVYDGVTTGGRAGSASTDPLSPARLNGGSYNGHSHTIQNLFAGSTDTADTGSSNSIAAGLFSQIDRGTVQDLTLQSLHVTANENSAFAGGVAAYMNGGTLQGITLNTPTVTLTRMGTDGGAETCVGGLAGYATGVKLDGCTGIDVTVTASTDVGNNARVGGLIGRLMGSSSTAVNCGLHATNGDKYDNTGVTFTSTNENLNDYAGGFAGDVHSARLTGCYAAVKVAGSKYVGGFAGQLNGATAEDCYSGGRVFVGTNPSVAYDYADPAVDTHPANVTGSGKGAHVGGFAGQATGEVTLKGICYTTCSVHSPNNNQGQNERYMGLFVGALSESGNGSVTVEPGSKGNGILYAGGSHFVNSGVKAVIRAEDKYGVHSGPALTGMKASPTLTTAHTHAYGVPSDIPFPYQTNLADHYGDWRQPVTYAGALYWEKEGSDYHFAVAATDNLGRPFTVTMPDHGHDGAAVTDWGYGTFYAGDNEGETLDVSTPSPSDIDSGNDEAATAFKETYGLNSSSATVTLLKKVTGTSADSTQVTVSSLAVGGDKTYTLNRAFAAAMEEAATSPEMGTSESNPYQIRTLGQLANISNSSSLRFAQTHDLNVTAHNAAVTDEYTHTPLSLTGAGTTVYDGGGYRILDLEVTGATGAAGLFGQVSATAGSMDLTLKNIVLYAPAAAKKMNTDGSGTAGGLVGSFAGRTLTVENCAVAGYDISAGSGTAGGLVGSFAGEKLSVAKSSAVSTLGSSGTAAAALGGLVGSVQSTGASDVSVSYAGGSIAADTATPSGGLVGALNGSGTVSIKTSYSYMTGTQYGIAPDASAVEWDTCAYRNGSSLPDDTSPYHFQANNAALTAWADDLLVSDKAVFGDAQNTSYVPETAATSFVSGSGLTANPEDLAFPFGAAVTDPRLKTLVHYGTWPDESSTPAPADNIPRSPKELQNAWAVLLLDNRDTPKTTDDIIVVWYPAGNIDRPSNGYSVWVGGDEKTDENDIRTAFNDLAFKADIEENSKNPRIAVIIRGVKFDAKNSGISNIIPEDGSKALLGSPVYLYQSKDHRLAFDNSSGNTPAFEKPAALASYEVAWGDYSASNKKVIPFGPHDWYAQTWYLKTGNSGDGDWSTDNKITVQFTYPNTFTVPASAPAGEPLLSVYGLDGGFDDPESFDETAPAPTSTPGPAPEATPALTPSPTPEPTTTPTPEPTPEPTPSPTPEPTSEPTPDPTPEPTPELTPEPAE